jgi:D-ribose pyranose/furanose isomerase RbsD
MNYHNLFIVLISFFVLASCQQTAAPVIDKKDENNWKHQFNKRLPLLGHRNWIIIVDKAFPQQNAAGIEYINTNENLLPVLKYALQQVNSSGNVKPIIYRDKELQFITEEQSKGVMALRNEEEKLIGSQAVETILHDSVFTKLDEASKLFKVLVLKTNETIPYSSVFLLLDCGYWNASKEAQLRKNMAAQ